MPKYVKKTVILITLLAVIAFPMGSFAMNSTMKKSEKEIGAGPMVFDLCIIRPFSLVATVFGSAAFIVSLPFSVIGGNSEAAYDKMVMHPAKFTFQRPLGKF